jgi:Tfp pilus assembly protein PilN
MESMLLERREERPELIIDEPQSDEGDLGVAAIAPPDFLPAGMRPSWLEAAAIGAALAQLNEARVRMNLLPPGLARAEEGIGLRELALAAVVVFLSLTLGTSIAFKNLSVSSALAAEVDRLLPMVTAVTKKEEQNRALLAKLQTLEKSRAVSVLAYLRDMTTRVPTGAYLTTFRYKGDRIELDGIADNAASLIAELEQSQYFKNVEFTAPTTKYLQDQERFSLKMELEQ